MATCKNCGKPLILNGGKCIYCSTPCGEKKGGMNKTVQPGLPPVRTFTVNGVSFNMILVEGGTMWIGEQKTDPRKPNYDPEADGRNPLRKVSVDTFYIGETLVTLGLIKALYRDTRPYRNEIGECETTPCWYGEGICSEVAAQIGEYFRLPTSEEWEFAARGGVKSKGYRFSGGNVLNEVGWYVNNHKDFLDLVGPVPFHLNGQLLEIPPQIKKKKNNELGLYDMSGLLYEPCVVTDGRSERVEYRGGHFKIEAKYSRVAYRLPASYVSGVAGLRLAMTPKHERARQ